MVEGDVEDLVRGEFPPREGLLGQLVEDGRLTYAARACEHDRAAETLFPQKGARLVEGQAAHLLGQLPGDHTRGPPGIIPPQNPQDVGFRHHVRHECHHGL